MKSRKKKLIEYCDMCGKEKIVVYKENTKLGDYFLCKSCYEERDDNLRLKQQLKCGEL